MMSTTSSWTSCTGRDGRERRCLLLLDNLASIMQSGALAGTYRTGYAGYGDLLLGLDNFEHLLDGGDLIADMLQHAPRVTILVTSRERLNLRSEWLFDVDG